MVPEELCQSLEQVFFMHRVATEPESVVPPGKSLMSMLGAASTQTTDDLENGTAQLSDRVHDATHKAFWDEVGHTLQLVRCRGLKTSISVQARDALSLPLPSVQLTRLKLLYADLGDATIPLLSKDHRLRETLRAHIAPTVAPLRSTMIMLKELLLALRGRCAPARDHVIDELYTKLDEWSEGGGAQTKQEAQASLANLITDTIHGIVKLADTMGQDIGGAAMNMMGEQHASSLAVMLAKINERDATLDLWNAKTDKGKVLREQWTAWNQPLSDAEASAFGTNDSDKQWVVRLMKQLATNIGVSCKWPDSIGQLQVTYIPTNPDVPTNLLPPHFLFVAPKLLQLQNRLQAITIAASLRALARLPVAPASARNDGTNVQDLVERVWSLLEGEIDLGDEGSSSQLGSTKIINLADEVIRARRQSSPTGAISAEEEARVRRDVERTLHPDDPVFRLLHRRLCDGLTTQTLDVLSGKTPVGAESPAVPKKMATGQTTSDGQVGSLRQILPVPDLGIPNTVLHAKSATATVLKGFEHPILVKAVQDVFRELLQCVAWIGYVWEDIWYVLSDRLRFLVTDIQN